MTEVLNGKREVSMSMISNLRERFQMGPAEPLSTLPHPSTANCKYRSDVQARVNIARIAGFPPLPPQRRSGSAIRTVKPGPSFSVAHRRPPCFSTIERLIHNPIPIPFSLVV